MGGGKRHAYHQEVWSPAGGYWAQPKTWRRNTAIVGLGTAILTIVIWKFSADREWRHQDPKRWIPSMLWAKQYRDPENFKPPRSSG